MLAIVGILVTASVLLIAAACGAESTEPVSGEAGATEASTPASTAAHAMSGTDAEVPFDAMFIDSMVEHHRGAIAMAEQVREESERPELRAMAEEIIDAQVGEIGQLESWRVEWYPGLMPTDGMGMAMGDMEVSGDDTVPFDQRFIQAMIAHHEGAVAMAEEALSQAEHDELRTLAQAIIDSQTGEIAQMKAWEAEWFGP
jgi:uncharacterized protein (DUF305 family)